MELFKVMNNVLNSKNTDWFIKLDGTEPAVVVHKWLGMNPKLLNYVKWLDKYVYNLSSINYIKLAWSIIPKGNRIPKYIKSEDEKDSMVPLYNKVKKVLNMDSNDWKYSKKYLIKEIESNKEDWFKRFGMDKKFWKQNGVERAKIEVKTKPVNKWF